MTYNRFLYNSALYNAGREEVGAVARSLIQAHTGPHIQAVVGGKDGVSFISDFNIIEGRFTRPPSAFNFPDLTAWIRAVNTDTADLGVDLFVWGAGHLAASIYPVAFIPNLPASIFGLLQSDLGGSLTGVLGQLDLPASLFIPQHELGGRVFGLAAPNLGGRIFGNEAGNLGAIIWAPHDLPATVTVLPSLDIPATITGLQFANLPAIMSGVPAPNLGAIIRGFASAAADLAAYAVVVSGSSWDLSASATPDFDGFRTTLPVLINATGGYHSIFSNILPVVSSTANLAANIAQFSPADLPATIDLLGADNLLAQITTIPFGEKNKELPGFLQAVHPGDLAALISANSNLHNLSATILSLHDTADLGAFIRAAETFITTILKIVTLNAVDLRATIGKPGCEGGSAYTTLTASLIPQFVGDLRASISSFINYDLGASINTNTVFHAFETIDVVYSRSRPRPTKIIRVADTITVNYAPFRGANLAASITGAIPSVDLGASISAAFLLPRVAPFVTRLTGMDLRPDHDPNIQEVRLQLEGALTEFFYVHGTDDAFIMDANEKWQINVRSFRELASNLFGDFAAARICRVGNILSFNTLDEAVRFCIAVVLGLEGEAELGAYINASGGIYDLRGRLGVSDKFHDLGAFANRVYPSDLLNAVVDATGGYGDLSVIVLVESHGSESLAAAIVPELGSGDLGAILIKAP